MPKPKWTIVILITILASQSTLQAYAVPTWTTQIVDPSGNGGKIAIDSNNNPHIVYYVDSIFNQPTTGLNYAVWTGNNWTKQTVDPSGAGGILILDASKNPHILYRDSTLDNLKYAVWNGANWTIHTIALSGVGGYAMAIDSSGKLHIAYSSSIYSNNTYKTNITYAVCTGSIWAAQTIDSEERSIFNSGLNPSSIVLDSNGHPHITYLENVVYEYYYSKSWNNKAFYSTNNIKYATTTGSNWSIQTIVTNASTTVGATGNLVLDSKAQPHLCYIHENFTYLPDYGTFMVRDSLNYVYWDGSAWLVRTIDPKPYNVFYRQPCLRLDSDNNPQVFFYEEDYHNPADTGLKYAKYSGSNWDIQTIGKQQFLDIAFDSYDNPHITYDMVMCTIHGAPKYGNLTYASLETPLFPSFSTFLTTFLVAIPIFIIAVVLVIIYKTRNKTAKGLPHIK